MNTKKAAGRALGAGFEGIKTSGLGRGLSALLGERDPDAAIDSATAEAASAIAIVQLKPNPFQPRTNFDDADLEDLVASIREKGVLQPLIVRADPQMAGHYQIIAGERRWRAAKRVGLTEVPVVIKTFDDGEALEIALIENIQRADLNAVEEARGYRQLIEKFGYAQEKLASVIGKSRSHIANTLRLLSLPKAVLDLIVSGKITAGHARALINTPNPEELARQMAEGGLSVREAEETARGAKGAQLRKRSSSKDADTKALELRVTEALGLAVTIDDKGEKGGSITIAYKTLEQLDDVCARLSRLADGL